MRHRLAAMVMGFCCVFAMMMPNAVVYAASVEDVAGLGKERARVLSKTHKPTITERAFETLDDGAKRARSIDDGERLTVSAEPTGLATVGVTWCQRDMENPDKAPVIRLRYFADGKWSGWINLPAADSEGGELGVSSSYYVGDADRVDAEIIAKDGPEIEARLITVDPGYSESLLEPSSGSDEGSAQERFQTRATGDAGTVTGRIHTREEWWVEGNPEMFWKPNRTGRWNGAIVHHTVDRNDYTQAEVPAMINGIYLLHNETRDWGDIGYQLIVDRFGGIWEGRDEGVPNQIVSASHVVGAQALNFNYDTFGVAMLGSYHLEEAPTDAQIASTAAAIAWEFRALGMQPSDAWGTFELHGTQQRISGHGDESHHVFGSNETLCPGEQVTARMNRIRDLVRTDMIGVSRMPMVNVANGEYYLSTLGRDFAVASIPNGATDDDVLPRLQRWDGTYGQRFAFTRQPDGSYVITAHTSGKALTVVGGVAADNAGVAQQPIGYGGKVDESIEGPTVAQRWFVRDSGDGYYIQSALGEEVLDLEVGSTADGTLIALYGPNGGSNQRWELHKVGASDVGNAGQTFVPGIGVTQDGMIREYRGASTIKRQDMAAFLYRWAGSPHFEPTAEDWQRFADVSWSTPFAKEIWWLADKGISTGWQEKDGSRTFRGNAEVTRQDMAAFMHRLVGDDGLHRIQSMIFSDVGWTTPHAEDIMWLASVGVSSGWLDSTGRREFRGGQPVVRQDMAAFLQRLAGVTDIEAEKAVRVSWGELPNFFRDVTMRTPHAWSVWWMGLEGISTGWTIPVAPTE